MPTISPALLPILMLFVSNVFMTFAWYGHLKFKESPLALVVLASWGIAFFEYWLAVPANRWGSAVYSAAQLKTMQEVITLIVFAAFSILYLKEPLGWNHVLGFGFIAVMLRTLRWKQHVLADQELRKATSEPAPSEPAASSSRSVLRG